MTLASSVEPIHDRSEQQYLALIPLYKAVEGDSVTIPSFFDQTPVVLSRKALTFLLVLVNGLDDLRPKAHRGNQDYWMYERLIQSGDLRWNYLVKHYPLDEFWNDEMMPVLVYLFGKERASYVAAAWDRTPELMYQRGYNRRSFRRPNNALQCFHNQLQLLQGLNQALVYAVSLEEEMTHAWEWYQGDSLQLALMWAAAMEAGRQDVKTLLLDIVYQRHPIAKMNNGVIRTLLLSEDKAHWKAISDLLLSAQRQEGLRQSIVECLDEGNLGAFAYFMNQLIEHDMARFSSIVRAVDVWMGLGWEAAKKKTVERFLSLGAYYLQHPAAIPEALTDADNAVGYVAIWAQGVLDIEQCGPLLQRWMKKGTLGKQHLALYLALEMDIPTVSLQLVEQVMERPHPKLFWGVVQLLRNHSWAQAPIPLEQRRRWFAIALEQLSHLPKDGLNINGLGFSWLLSKLERSDLGLLLMRLTCFDQEEEVQQLLEQVAILTPYQREQVVRQLYPQARQPYESEPEHLEEESLPVWKRALVFDFLKDRSATIQTLALSVIRDLPDWSPLEVQALELLLKRKSADTRKEVLLLLRNRPVATLQASTTRLLASKNVEQRLGGLDLLQYQHQQGDQAAWVATQVAAYQQRKTITQRETVLLDAIAMQETTALNYNWANGLGLYDRQALTEPIFPVLSEDHPYHQITQQHPAGWDQAPEQIGQALSELYALIIKHKDHCYEAEDWNGSIEEMFLGQAFYPFKRQLPEEATPEEHLNNYPLATVWRDWWMASGLSAKDLYLIQFYKDLVFQPRETALQIIQNRVIEPLGKIAVIPAFPSDDYYWSNTVETILTLLSAVYPYVEAPQFLDGFCRRFIALLEPAEYHLSVSTRQHWSWNIETWNDLRSFQYPCGSLSSLAYNNDELFNSYWEITYWQERQLFVNLEEPLPSNTNLWATLRAYTKGLVNEHALYGQLLQSDNINLLTSTGRYRDDVRKKLYEKYPFIKEKLNICLSRILDIELARGDSSTPATELAVDIHHVEGMDYFIRILQMLGKETLHRGYSWGTDRSKKEVASQLLKNCYPAPTDTSGAFNERVKAAKLSDKRLIEAALYAPQWMHLVQGYLNWNGLLSAAWWMHAHTKANNTAEMETEIARYSKISLADFGDGAVDSVWFKQVYKTLGKDRWTTVYQAAKYITSGPGHRRAQLYADVLLGRLKIREVTKKVKDKRNQEYLRMYGLVPLSKKIPEKDLLQRYAYLQQFLKESKQFGAQKQASERLAVNVALQNLAQISGYGDPLRLTWAMEGRQAQQLLAESPPLVFDEVTIALEINTQGKASLRTTKAGKLLKSLPAKLRKKAEVVALKARLKTLREQYRRTRRTLEQMMIDGATFEQAEVLQLLQHPIVAPQLQQLVGKSGTALGFFTADGLRTVGGEVHPYGKWTSLAHCYDLYASGNWLAYQEHCFDAQVVQPFKQIFRTLYLPTEDELQERTYSSRYAGHQVQPSKTVALLKSRGWTVDYDEGLQYVNHQERLVARLYAVADWFTPADTESPTLETLHVHHLDTGKPVPWSDLPPRFFSELMRDVDLVVSVAHVGGVDPEASHSSIQMRAALVEQTARLFRLDNVRIDGRHVLIDGEYGTYTIHLGSAQALLMPGRALDIVAVQSQHRGRLFLPFVDDDPRSAELLSKVLLLAKDGELQDPSILGQLGK